MSSTKKFVDRYFDQKAEDCSAQCDRGLDNGDSRSADLCSRMWRGANMEHIFYHIRLLTAMLSRHSWGDAEGYGEDKDLSAGYAAEPWHAEGEDCARCGLWHRHPLAVCCQGQRYLPIAQPTFLHAFLVIWRCWSWHLACMTSSYSASPPGYRMMLCFIAAG